MKYTLALLPLLASTAFAQEDPWKSLSKGDRIQITFRSGNTIQGMLTARPGDPRVTVDAVDYGAATEVTLDVSLEYPGLNGTLTIPKKEIKEVRKLQALDPATMKRIQDEVKRIQAQAAADEATRKAAEDAREQAAKKARAEKDKEDEALKANGPKGADLVKDAEDLKKGLEYLSKFPPDKWGPQTIKEVGEKALRKQPVTPMETEFLDPEVQRLWQKALAWQNSQKKDNK